MSRWQDDLDDLYDVELELDPALFDESQFRTIFPSDGFSDPLWLRPLCAHPPQCVLKGTDAGWSIFAGAGADCLSSMVRFDFVLNLTGESLFRKHVIPVPELAHWEGRGPRVPELVLDWPDMGTVDLPRQFWVDLIEHLNRTSASMLVFCVGGHGRTGTAIASLMVACGWTSADATAWVRAHYCGRAIETDEQEDYVRWIAGEVSQVTRKGKRWSKLPR
ncbi:MAG TPA: protein-tyrosine phosphatase family protein [Edaphobacter sp.]|nr:protein-tyrosine phosphatase family protein [Edaphobacter sp.]